MTELPPLPEPYQIWETWGQNVDVFTADEMREYAKQAVEADRDSVKEMEAQADNDCAYAYADGWNAAIRARASD